MKSKNFGNMCVLCFGGQDWWYHNRSHVDIQLMRQYAKRGPVLYVNSIVMQKPKVTQGRKFIRKLVRKSKSIFRGLKKVDTNFWVYSPISLPLHHLNWGRKLNEKILRFQLNYILRKLGLYNPLVWIVCPAACNTALSFRNSKLVYLRTDVYELFPNVDFDVIKRYDLKLKANADLTLLASSRLFHEESDQCKRALYLDHGVDYEKFASMGSDINEPTDIKNIKKPIVGYFGSIDGHTVDYELVDRLADLLPEVSFVFVGKIYDDPSRVWKKNVWMMGHKSYDETPLYGKCFDVAIMPWLQTPWIQACNPIKLKEYLALGKPVVSTPFAELQKYQDVVYQANTPEEFAECIEKALAEDSPKHIAARRKKVVMFTWDSKAKLVLNKLFEK